MAYRGGRSVKETNKIDWSDIPDEAIDASKISNLSKTVVSITTSNTSVSESSLSSGLRHKIQTAKDLAEYAAATVAFKFQQEIDNLEGVLRAKIDRAAVLAGNALQPGVRGFLQSLQTSTVQFGFQSINADTDISSTQATFYKVLTGGGNVTITLPTATTCPGLMLGFKKALAANSMIIDGAGPQTINGTTTKTFTAQHDAIVVVSDGSNWVIISNYS
tara:strand:+ start:187 stop:840 length:654 start_codon:yes stop_codon:yes gene_type:complete